MSNSPASRGYWQRRKNENNPFSPICKTSFRRICGVCTGFPIGADMRAKAQPCEHLSITVNGTANAADCKHWSRKG